MIVYYVLAYGMLILTALGIDWLLHLFDLVWIGRYAGIPGTLLLIVSMAYSLRKRKIIQTGSPKNYLEAHKYLGWLGGLIILVHAGIHFNALIPWLALIAMLVVIASGFTGSFLMKKAREQLKQRQQEMKKQGISNEDLEKELFFELFTVEVFKKWWSFHMPMTTFFVVLSLFHIVSVLLLW
jgi:hypothetical protein